MKKNSFELLLAILGGAATAAFGVGVNLAKAKAVEQYDKKHIEPQLNSTTLIPTNQEVIDAAPTEEAQQ